MNEFPYCIGKHVLDIVYERPYAGYWIHDEWKMVVASFCQLPGDHFRTYYSNLVKEFLTKQYEENCRRVQFVIDAAKFNCLVCSIPSEYC